MLSAGALLAPTERWVFKIEPLSKALGGEPRTRPAWVWLPCLQVSVQVQESSGAMHPSLEVGDLLLRSNMRCTVYKARTARQHL